MKTIIHVNQQRIVQNRKNRTNNPVITVKNYKENVYCHECRIDGPSTLVYRPDNPLSCGAKCWIETTSTVEIVK